jgi:hypothetical protein
MVDANDDISSNSIIETNEWRWVFIASTLLAILVSLPFIFAYTAAGPGVQFMGVLVNPQDGMSYLAKMYQGYNGTWLFHLAYTPEHHRGVFLYTFYLALGHIARLLNLPLILVWHASRLIGTLLMLVTLYRFISDWTGDITQRRVTWGLAAVASGFAWILLLFGHVTPDLLTLPEAFPLQAAYANAHFPWAISVIVWISHCLIYTAAIDTRRSPTLDAHTTSLVAATLLAVSISPFALVPIAAGYATLCALLWIRRRSLPRREIAWGGIVIIFALPLVGYGEWAISGANPVFQAWMAQNLTPSPPIWDYLAAFGPLLILGAIGIWGARRYLRPEHFFLVGWIVATVLLLYSPFGLQRRFSMGITIPLAIFAGIGLWRVIFPLVGERWHTMLLVTVLSLTAPTTIIAIALPLVGVRHPADTHFYYASRAEVQGMSWLQAHASPSDAIVLASPDISLYLPTYGLRVVYGHPFETLHAEERKQEVAAFFQGTDCSVISREQVLYVFVGAEERHLADGQQMCPIPGRKVFSSTGEEVVIYAITGQ